MKKENTPIKKNTCCKKERWLCNPKNKAIVQELKNALKEKADRFIDLSDFKEK